MRVSYNEMRSIFKNNEYISMWPNYPTSKEGFERFEIGLLFTESINEYQEEKLTPLEVAEILDFPTEVEYEGRVVKCLYIFEGRIRFLSGYLQYDPMISGVVVYRKNPNHGGTLGTFVWDEDNEPYILSCSHVIAPDYDDRVTKGDPVYQGDGRAEIGPSGHLHNWSSFHEVGFFDAAIATMVQDFSETEFRNLGDIINRNAVEPKLNDTVEKLGTATGNTVGTITHTSVNVMVSYTDTLFVSVENVYTISGSSGLGSSGDSGSLVRIQGTDESVGILFSSDYEGEDSSEYHALPVKTIEQGLNVKFKGKRPTYRVERSVNGGAWTQVSELFAESIDLTNEVEYKDYDVVEGNTYDYRVTLNTMLGDSTVSTTSSDTYLRVNEPKIFIDENKAPESIYEYQVRSETHLGVSPWSSIALAKDTSIFRISAELISDYIRVDWEPPQ